MTLELAERRHNMPYIDCPNWVEVLVLLTILASDLWQAAKPVLLEKEIYALARYDKAWRDISYYRLLLPIARIFVGCWCIFLLIEVLEGIVKWIH